VAAAGAAGAVAHAETVSSKLLLAIVGAALAAALTAGCGGGAKESEKSYAIGPTEQCLHAQGERAVRNQTDPSVLTLQWSYLRFHPSVEEAKAFDVSTLSTNFAGYDIHRIRHANVSLIWATGGRRHVSGPRQAQIRTVERCLREE
jgi:hypothetical protein